jgi:hypothetical protein
VAQFKQRLPYAMMERQGKQNIILYFYKIIIIQYNIAQDPYSTAET